MSILIKGMEMPTGCRLCHFKEWTNSRDGWFCPLRHKFLSKRAIIRDKRYDDCPLVEIPPHGKVIDADKFMKPFYDLLEKDEHSLDYYSVSYGGLKVMIDNAPTVIESEKQDHE